MRRVDELKYSQSVWGFQPRKAEIRKVCMDMSKAYGFRDFKYFRLKIFDLPSTDIRKRL